jgi:arsenate reductase
MKILVLCTGNSCRSQIAHGYLQKFAGDKAEVFSAGVEVHGLNPIAVGVMNEDGVNISHYTSNHVDEYENEEFDYVITVCDSAKERCPYFPAKVKLIHHSFTDPAGAEGTVKEILAEFRSVRDQIRAYSSEFIASL